MKKKTESAVPLVEREMVRQMIHLGLGLSLASVLYTTNIVFFRQFLIGLLLIGAVFSYIAMTKKWKWLNRVLASVERPTETVPGQSAFMFVSGVMIPAFLFSNPMAVFLSIIGLSLQDAFSALIGIRFGKTKILPTKSVEGSLAGFVVCLMGFALFLPFYPAFLLALSAAVVELFPFDDSLSIPVFVAFMAHAFV